MSLTAALLAVVWFHSDPVLEVPAVSSAPVCVAFCTPEGSFAE